MNGLIRFSILSRVAARKSKRGLSILELIGCVAAIAAGIWVGASYLKIDLQTALQIGLEKAGISSGPAKLAQGDPAAAAGPNPTPAAGGPGEVAGGPSPGAVDADATLGFWNRVRDIIRDERASRGEGAVVASGDSRAILFAQAESFQNAAYALTSLAATGVDGEVVELAQDLAGWYARGAELSEEGTRLDEADLASASGPPGRRWHTAQRQHREQLDLLTRKAGSLQSKLTAKYETPFPELR